MSEKKEQKSLFDKFLENAENVVSTAKRPLIRNRVKRAFASAEEGIKETLIDKESELIELRAAFIKNPEDATEILNEILSIKAEMYNSDYTLELINEEKKELFNK